MLINGAASRVYQKKKNTSVSSCAFESITYQFDWPVSCRCITSLRKKSHVSFTPTLLELFWVSFVCFEVRKTVWDKISVILYFWENKKKVLVSLLDRDTSLNESLNPVCCKRFKLQRFNNILWLVDFRGRVCRSRNAASSLSLECLLRSLSQTGVDLWLISEMMLCVKFYVFLSPLGYTKAVDVAMVKSVIL